jgi:hypothetical protein
MDADRFDELMARDALTDAELAELERHVVDATREFHRAMITLTEQVALSDPIMALELARSADNMMEHVEKAAALPWPDGSPGTLAN